MATKNTEKQRKKLKRYDLPGHAHELIFSCYQGYPYMSDPTVCRIFLDELERARELFFFKIWAYVLMLNHVHILIWPYKSDYKIASILQSIKGRTSKRYKDILKDTNPDMLRKFLINQNGLERFRFWQAGGGFDRNLWNAKAIHYSINYIEANPVRAGLVDSPNEWDWSSARNNKSFVTIDRIDIPVLMK